MKGFIQKEPGSREWVEGFFSEFVCDDKKGKKIIIPDFNRFIASVKAAIETDDEEEIKKFLLGNGKIVRFELRKERQAGVKLCLCFVAYDKKFNNKKWKDIEEMCPVKKCNIGQLLENTVEEPDKLTYLQNFQIVTDKLTVTKEKSGLMFHHSAFEGGNLFIADSEINDFPEVQTVYFFD